MPRSPFDLPEYSISLGKRYRLRPDAGREWPELAVVTKIDGGWMEFEDATNGDLYETTTAQFRDAFDPA